MCTVTFIPVNNAVFITHNRDEQRSRPAVVPAVKKTKNGSLLYPSDSKAGGSWIGINSNGNAAVLLNGAFEKHEAHPPYLRSRGLVFIDILSSKDMTGFYASMNLQNIEPFTVILWDGVQLFECRWDGRKKHQLELSARENHMWSSATLYDKATAGRRKSWFENWIARHPYPTAAEIFAFHETGGEGDEENDLLMSRPNGLMTLSITSMEVTNDHGTMRYKDLASKQSVEKKILFQKAPVKY